MLYGAVIGSEGSSVEIGATTIVNENAVIRATSLGDRDHPVVVGDHVLIGPQATVLGCQIASCAYIATGATVLHGAVVGAGANVAVGALVHANTVIPDELFVPPNTVAVGDPVEIYAPGDERVAGAIKAARFAESAFGVQAEWEARIERYRQSTEARAAEFASHFDDVTLADDASA